MTIRSPMSLKFYKRINSYLYYLKQLPSGGPTNISASMIAAALGVNDVQVRKDLDVVSAGGKPRVGYNTKGLIADIEHFLMYDNCSDAAIVGVGNLGKALLSYENFRKYGLNIVIAFDNDKSLTNTEIHTVKVLDAGKITNLCKRMKIHIGIIAVPAVSAQEACDALVSGGVRAIWNFAPVKLQVPEKVIVRQEDMAASLAILTKQLVESMSDSGWD